MSGTNLPNPKGTRHIYTDKKNTSKQYATTFVHQTQNAHATYNFTKEKTKLTKGYEHFLSDWTNGARDKQTVLLGENDDKVFHPS